jgi:hypothetical protein
MKPESSLTGSSGGRLRGTIRDDEARGALDLAVEVPGIEADPPDGLVDLLEFGNREGRGAECRCQRGVLELAAACSTPSAMIR